MAKILKKKFFEVDIPLVGEKYETYTESLESLNGKTIKLDVARKLKGKSVDLVFKIQVENGKAVATPKNMTLLPFFIKHMLHKGVSYVEDSFKAETKESEVMIKPFLITRKKVSRAVRNTLRNSAKNWLIDYFKTKTDYEAFDEILTNQIQKPLSIKLKKVYPLAVCEIRIFEIIKPLTVKVTEIKAEEVKEKEVAKVQEEIKEEVSEEKPKKVRKSKKTAVTETETQ